MLQVLHARYAAASNPAKGLSDNSFSCYVHFALQVPVALLQTTRPCDSLTNMPILWSQREQTCSEIVTSLSHFEFDKDKNGKYDITGCE